MTFKMTPAADGLSATLGVGANDALKIDDAAKRITPVAPFTMPDLGLGQSLAQKGYAKLPGGLIVQWLTVPGSVADNMFVFAIPFPTAVLGVAATPVSAQPAGGVALTCSLRSVTTSGGITQARYLDAAQVIPSSTDIYIIAVGY